MRVLNNNNGTLTYNRCTNCDQTELKCKVHRRLRSAVTLACALAPCARKDCPLQLADYQHCRRPHPVVQDATSCAPGANGALDGCTACKTGFFLDSSPVSVQYIDTSNGEATPATKNYKGCRSCVAAFGCEPGKACNSSEWQPGAELQCGGQANYCLARDAHCRCTGLHGNRCCLVRGVRGRGVPCAHFCRRLCHMPGIQACEKPEDKEVRHLPGGCR